jgi:PilZ domain
MMFKTTVRKTEKRCALAPKQQPFPADFNGTWTLMPLSAPRRFKHNRKRNNEEADGEQICNGATGLTNLAQATAKTQRRRKFSRHRLDARVQLSVFREGLTTKLWGRTSEIGQDGVGATLSGEVRVGEVVSLEFPIPLPPHIMKVRAVVRYSEGLRCGLEFLVVTNEQKLTLHQLCVMSANAF